MATETKKRANAVVSVTREGSTLIFTVEGAGTERINVTELSEKVRERGCYHGLEQRGRDAAAIPRDPDTGRSATPAEKFAAVQRVIKRLRDDGEWELERTGGIGAGGGDLYRAMRELHPTSKHAASVEAFNGWIDASAKAQSATVSAVRAKLAATPAVKAILDRYAADRTKGIDGDALMEGFDE